MEDHLKEAKKLKHKADATVFIKPSVDSDVVSAVSVADLTVFLWSSAG